MAKRLGIREARKAAMQMAAAMVRDADFDSLFGGLNNEYADQPDIDEVFDRAQREVADRIQRMAAPDRSQSGGG